ncbi:MAG: helix-turn-helix transcriptional regulator, partial [Euryarchaeota archaeon]|nr:helix-turn-helix transcriptional regulator [Euryarchaeota archaeon]
MARTVSNSEKVLILLKDLESYCDAVEVPFLLCQEGMAERLGLQIQNMSRTLAKMQEEGLISERLAHVSGAGRRRKVYHLTETGRVAASKVVEDITGSQASVREGKTTRTMTTNELLSMLRDRGKVVPLLDLVDILSKDLVAIEDLPSGRSRQEMPPSFLAIGKPDPVEMIGRKEELAGIDSLISDPKVKCILIWGLPGMGKTTLGMAMFDRLKGGRPLFWYTVREFDSDNDVLEPLASMMRESGQRLTSNALATADIAQMYGPLASDLSKWKGIIFIDDAHKSGESMNIALNLLMEACKAQSGSKIVLMSRMMNRAFSHNREDLVDVELQGLKPSDAEEMVRSAGHEADGLHLEGTKGNPLLIQMAVRSRGGEEPRSSSDYVDNLWSHLSEKERECLKALAIYREFVPPAA